MNSITTLSFLDELEKIAEEKKDSASRRTTLKATAVGGAVGGAVGLSKGLHAAAHAPKVIGSGPEKLLLNPKETKKFKRLLVASGTGRGVAKGMQYGLMAGVAGGVAKKLLKREKKKEASHAAELAGLGLLAAPSVSHLRGKEWSEKNKARAEVGGLGILAAPSALAVGKRAVEKGKAVARAANVGKLRNSALAIAKHAAVKSIKKVAAPSMSAMMNMHRLADAAKSAKSVAKPAAQAVKLPTQATHAVRAQQFSGHTATGGHAWNPATQAKRAIPL